ncbi:fucolectin-3-like [Cololabis saira]|uniref:fucolectin-3-like n=1 Tax=Cololabis saira TaxID=129043 RepID=UPI002AD32B72|nr:fucolectin-3-like [Cololabis saira]
MIKSVIFLFPVTAQNVCRTNNVNLTQKKTFQSSNYSNQGLVYVSDRAVDGNFSTCSNSEEERNSWWTIDLKGVYKISCISIYNKNATHSDITGAQIFIGDLRQNNGLANTLVKNITKFRVEDKHNQYKFKPPVSGRYVTVRFSDNKPAVLCEVNITGTIIESPFQLIKQKKTWEEALYYCRYHHSNLASILDNRSQAFAELEAERADTPFVWLGIHYTCTLQFWFWVDGNVVQFHHFLQSSMTEDCDMSGAMHTREDYYWHKKSDYDEYNFICAL